MNQDAEITDVYVKISQLIAGPRLGDGTRFFITEARAMNQVERGPMIARGRADLSVRQQ